MGRGVLSTEVLRVTGTSRCTLEVLLEILWEWEKVEDKGPPLGWRSSAPTSASEALCHCPANGTTTSCRIDAVTRHLTNCDNCCLLVVCPQFPTGGRNKLSKHDVREGCRARAQDVDVVCDTEPTH